MIFYLNKYLYFKRNMSKISKFIDMSPDTKNILYEKIITIIKNNNYLSIKNLRVKLSSYILYIKNIDNEKNEYTVIELITSKIFKYEQIKNMENAYLKNDYLNIIWFYKNNKVNLPSMYDDFINIDGFIYRIINVGLFMCDYIKI